MAKAIHSVKRSASKQPQIPSLLPNKFSRKLLAAFVPIESGPGLRDYVSNVKAVGSFGPAGSNIRYRQPSPIGLGLYLDGSYVTWQAGASRSPFQIAQGFTVCWGGSYQIRDTVGAFFFSMFDSARISQAACSSNGGAIRMTLGTSVFNFPGVNSDSIYDGKTVHSAVTFNNANTIAKLFINGSKLSEVTTSSNSGNLGADPYFTLGTGMGLNTGEAYDGTQNYFYIFDGELTPNEILRIRSNPWQLFEDDSQSAVSFYDAPLNRIYSFPTAATKQPIEIPRLNTQWGLRPAATFIGSMAAVDPFKPERWSGVGRPTVIRKYGKSVNVNNGSEGIILHGGGKTTSEPCFTFIGIFHLGAGNTDHVLFKSSFSTAGFTIYGANASGTLLTFSIPTVADVCAVALTNNTSYACVVSHRRDTGESYIFARPLSGGDLLIGTNTATGSSVASNGIFSVGSGIAVQYWSGDIGLAFASYDFMSQYKALALLNNPWALFEDRSYYFAAPTVTVSVYRPNSDISITGWTGVPLSNLYDNINESVLDTADYNLSPALSGTPSPAIHGLEGSPLPTGTYTIGVTASTTFGTGYIRVRLYDNSSVEVGASLLQPVNTSDTVYYLNITTTGDAYRCGVEFTN
jgi:hypothetical protein